MDAISIVSHECSNGDLLLKLSGIPQKMICYTLWLPDGTWSAVAENAQARLFQDGQVYRLEVEFSGEEPTVQIQFAN